MDWKEVLAKLRLVDVSPEVKGDQVGAINVKVENNTYNITLPAGVGLGAMDAIKLTPEFERKVKEEAERRLIKLGIPPDLLSGNSRIEIASATTAASAVNAIEGEVGFEGKVTAVMTPKSEKPKK